MIIKELTAEEKRRYRRLEYIPGILIWTTFAAVIILSFIRPYWAIIFIIAFDLYWMLRIFYLLVYLLTSYKRLKKNIKIDRKSTRLNSSHGYISYAVFCLKK